MTMKLTSPVDDVAISILKLFFVIHCICLEILVELNCLVLFYSHTFTFLGIALAHSGQHAPKVDQTDSTVLG